jgi:DNA polymerase-1
MKNLGDLYCFLSADGSQIEVRQLAEVSGDPILISHFESGRDVHCLVGHDLTGWSVERIKNEKNLRKMVKNMHFGIIYGLGRGNLYPYVVQKIRAIDGENADLTGITESKLVRLYDRYFQVYKGVAEYMKRTRQMAEEKGYVETLIGPFRVEIKKEDSSRTTYWANRAVNIPIQGTAHQFVLVALALLHLKPVTYNLLQSCLMEIHDDLTFRVKLRDLSEAYKQLMNLFSGAYEYVKRQFQLKLRVPLVAEAKAGFCLGSAVEYAGEPVDEFLPRWRAKQRSIEAKSWEDLMPAASIG